MGDSSVFIFVYDSFTCVFFFHLFSVSSPVLLSTVEITGFEDVENFDQRTLPSVDESTLNVTWRPPTTPNGMITSYRITVNNTGISVPAVNGQSVYTELVRGLCELACLYPT